MLASMSEIDPRADAPLVDWSDLGVSGLLPTGTVTLLLADVEGSTRLWETQPEEMTAAFARLDHTLSDLIAAHDGVRPVEQGEGDSFVVAFARASDAVACALELQRAPLAPIRCGSACTPARCSCAMKATTSARPSTARRGCAIWPMVARPCCRAPPRHSLFDLLPADAWLTDLGTHELRDVAPPGAGGAAVPSRSASTTSRRCARRKAVAAHNLPVQLTSFVGRDAQLAEVRELLAQNRLVTLTGAGGVGKTRLAVQIAGQLAAELRRRGLVRGSGADHRPRAGAGRRRPARSGCPINPVARRWTRCCGLSATAQMLVVLDNCEHLLDASAELVDCAARARLRD